MAGRECYHCKQWVDEGEAHDCWTTTEAALTGDLSEDLRDAYDRLRETAVEFGEQRIYASHRSIMFSRKSCYFFVRPKRNHLELVVFLGRTVHAPQIRKVIEGSKTKRAHVIRVTHRDQVESPVTDWLREAYVLPDVLARAPAPPRAPARKRAAVTRTKRTKRTENTTRTTRTKSGTGTKPTKRQTTRRAPAPAAAARKR